LWACCVEHENLDLSEPLRHFVDELAYLPVTGNVGREGCGGAARLMNRRRHLGRLLGS
jgi:hypothetical protein